MEFRRRQRVRDHIDRRQVVGPGNSGRWLASARFAVFITIIACGVYLFDQLRRLGAASVVKGKGTGEEALLAEVPQATKTAFLLGLNAHREEIRHLHIEEPSLERVYFEND